MAAAFPTDEEAKINNNNYKKPDPADSVGNDEDNEGLTAEFRHRLGILDDDSDLTEAFKASIGILTTEGNMGVDEIIWQMDEERDATISRFKFSKYLKDNLVHKSVDYNWTAEPIKHAMLPKKHDVDKMASLATFLAIQRFMGDSKAPDHVPKMRSKVPIISRLYRTLEAYARGRKTSSSTAGTEESFKLKKRKSWKKIFKRTNSEREAEEGRVRKNTDDEYTYTYDITALAHELPTDELDLTHFIIGHAILRKDLRDEIYCQLCKQLANNPSKESEALGWRLISMCCSTFLPSDNLDKYFRCFLKDVKLEFKEYAGYARRMMRRVATTGMRYHPPNWLEFQAAKIKKYVLLPVSFADHSVESVEADASTTAGEMCSVLANKIGLKDDFGFSIFISIYDKVSSLGSSSDHVMDAISECEQIVRGKGKLEEDAPWRLYYRKEYFSPWHDPSYDEVSTHLIYKQICRGVRSEEYQFRSEEDLVKFIAQRLYIEHKGELIPGKIQQDLQKSLPKSQVQDGKARDSWTQSIMAVIQERGYVEKKTPASRVKESLVYSASRRWPMQFSGLFEAYKITGPVLPKNEVVVAVNCKGLFIMHEPYKISKGYPYFEVVEVFASKSSKHKGMCFNLITIKGDEFTFLSPNSETVSKLVATFLDGLRQRSVYCIGLQPYVFQAEGDSTAFKFGQGDFIQILDEKPNPAREDWVVGRCDATNTKGQFPLDSVYLIPTLEKPPPEFIYMFQGMTNQAYDTLPRQKGAVQISQGTIGRHTKFGKESAA